jgi:hypothetical protein
LRFSRMFISPAMGSILEAIRLSYLHSPSSDAQGVTCRGHLSQVMEEEDELPAEIARWSAVSPAPFIQDKAKAYVAQSTYNIAQSI